MKKTVPVFFALFLLSALLAFPQSSFLKTGQTGFGTSGAYTTNKDASGFSGTAGVALSGIFDLSLSVGRPSYGSDTYADLKATSIVSEIRAYIIKQNSGKAPVTASISVGYSSDKFSSPDFEADSLVMRAHSMLMGGTVSRDVPLSAKVYIQPYAGISYVNSTLKISDPSGLTLGSTDGMVSLNLGVPLVYGLSERTMAVLQPAVSLDKNNVTFAVSAGLIIALTKAPELDKN